MFQCGMNFQSIPLYIVYSSQHFEPIVYGNSPFRSSLIFRAHDAKIHIDLDDFPFFLKINEAKTSYPIFTIYMFILE